ncbi:hypothetical protein PQX77_016205 [Marasmius sp. AFHP31]|nr:hypothetical protein PQX77_016205 [Marasmius sp. AFHP31]
MVTKILSPLLLNLVGIATTWALGSNVPQIQLGSAGPTVVGKTISENVEFFGGKITADRVTGIPYAEAPVGDLRLRPAEIKDYSEPGSKDTIVNATNYGKACLQHGKPRESVSEDCLSLNIFRPSGDLLGPDASLPILLWLHGGGITGSGSSPDYDGTALVERSLVRNSPIIVMTINFRLGPLGHPRGKEVDGQQDVLNLGSQDQIVALQWVKQNIKAFGGDPSKVTVFGESSGGLSIELLLMSGKIQGLARGAILESSGRLPMYNSSVQDSKWLAYIQNIPSCAESTSQSVDCLRSNATSDELYNAFAPANITGLSFEWTPVIDGPGGVLPDYPSGLAYPDDLNVAIMFGNVLDEGTFMHLPQSTNSTDDILTGLFDMISPSPRGDDELRQALSELLTLYPDDPGAGSPFNTGNETFGLDKEYKRFAAILTDMFVSSQRKLFAKQFAASEAASKAPLYMFLFADPHAVSVMPREFQPPEGSYAPGSLGVPHTGEINYVFGHLEIENSTMPQSAKDLNVKMMDYWISFAVELNPNDGRGDERPDWPEYFSSSSPVLMQLKGGEIEGIPDTFREAAIQFIEDHSLVFAA